MFVPNRALVGSQQPALEQGGNPMNPWEQVFVPGFPLDLPIVNISLQLPVCVQAIRSDSAVRFDGLGNKSMSVSRLKFGMHRKRMRPMPWPSSSAATMISALL